MEKVSATVVYSYAFLGHPTSEYHTRRLVSTQVHYVGRWGFYNSPESTMVTFFLGVPELVPCASIFLTRSSPSNTFPNTTWRPSNQGVLTVVMKNCDPLYTIHHKCHPSNVRQYMGDCRALQSTLQQSTYLVLGPALAILKYMGPSCLSSKLVCIDVCTCVSGEP